MTDGYNSISWTNGNTTFIPIPTTTNTNSGGTWIIPQPTIIVGQTTITGQWFPAIIAPSTEAPAPAPEEQKKEPGCVCIKCKERNEYAEATEGKDFVCYKCRHGY